MKKIVCITLAILAVVALAACKGKKSGYAFAVSELPEVCDVYVPSAIAGLNTGIELTAWTQDNFNSPDQAPALTKTVNGRTFAGTYTDSNYVKWTFDVEHNYRTEDGDEFSVNDEGTVVRFKISAAPSEGETVSKEKAAAIAEQLIKSIYPSVDLDRYDKNISLAASGEYFSVSVIKSLDGLMSFDHIEMKIAPTGEVFEYSSYIFGKITDEMFSEPDLEKAGKKAAEKCARASETTVKNYDSRENHLYSVILTLDGQGKPALIYINETVFQKLQGTLLSTAEAYFVLYFSNDKIK